MMSLKLPLRQQHFSKAQEATRGALAAYPDIDTHEAFNKYVKDNQVHNIFFLDDDGHRNFWEPGKIRYLRKIQVVLTLTQMSTTAKTLLMNLRISMRSKRKQILVPAQEANPSSSR